MPKKILLLNPARESGFKTTRIHMGLSLLATLLKEAGHTARVVDYSFLSSLDEVVVPPVETVIREFQPDVIGISVFTYLFKECQELIQRVADCTLAPIILGGPHLTIFPEDFLQDKRIACLVVGEAEEKILEIVARTARHETGPEVIRCTPVPAERIPAIDLTCADGSRKLKDFQIQLSRGCPYGCTFCNIKLVAGRRTRPRDIDACLEEIRRARASLPELETISITDDCPAFDHDRFKGFLRKLAAMNLGCGLWIDNIRADDLDQELIDLYKQAGGRNLCMGVESGDPEVFKAVNKGEDLEDVRRAAALVKASGLTLGMCFVIGLPGDSWTRHQKSIALAKALKPSYVFWNMCIPWPGSAIHDWFQKNGRIGDPRNCSTLIDVNAHFDDPTAESTDFNRHDRIRAWLAANLETHRYFTKVSAFPRLLWLTARYNLWRSFGIYFVNIFLPAFCRTLHLHPPAWLKRLVRSGFAKLLPA